MILKEISRGCSHAGIHLRTAMMDVGSPIALNPLPPSCQHHSSHIIRERRAQSHCIYDLLEYQRLSHSF